MKRAALEGDLGGPRSSPRAVVKAAEVAGYWCWAVSTDASLLVRGRRRGARFVVTFVEGKCDSAYWWTREHETLVHGFPSPSNEKDRQRNDSLLGDEMIRWTSEQPEPRSLGYRELIRKIKETL